MTWFSSLSTSFLGTLAVLAQEKPATPEAPAAPAPGAAPGAPPAGGGGGGLGGMLLPILLMFAVVWFLMIAPERRKQKTRQAMIRNVKKGDQVVTAAGIVGKVVKDVKQEDREVVLQVDRDNDVRMKFLKSAIQEVLPEGAPSEVKDSAGPGREPPK